MIFIGFDKFDKTACVAILNDENTQWDVFDDETLMKGVVAYQIMTNEEYRQSKYYEAGWVSDEDIILSPKKPVTNACGRYNVIIDMPPLDDDEDVQTSKIGRIVRVEDGPVVGYDFEEITTRDAFNAGYCIGLERDASQEDLDHAWERYMKGEEP